MEMWLQHGYLPDLESLCTGWSGEAFGIVWNVVQVAWSSWSLSEFWAHHSIPKRRQVLSKIAGFHIGYNLFAPYLLFYCTDFSQIWYPRKAIFEENPTPYVTKDEDYSLWKTSAITEIAPLGSFWRYWWLSNPDLGHFGTEIWLSLVGFQGSGYFYCGMGL